MADFLVIRLDKDPQADAEWIIVDSNGTRRSEPASGPLREAAGLAGDRDVIVLVPAAETATFTVDLPARGARLRAALPFALEEQVADEIENLHFAAGNRLPNGNLPVVTVTHERMQDWLTLLAEAGIKAAQLVPENHGLAFVPNTLSLLLESDVLMFNDGVETQFVIEGVGPVDVLTAAGALGDENEIVDEEAAKHLLVYSEPEAARQHESDWTALRVSLDGIDINLLPDGALSRLAVTVASGKGVNLLQGPYGERTDFTALLRPWRFAAILLLSLGVVGMIAKGVDYYRLVAEESVLKQQFTEEYRRIRPGDTREVMDPVSTVQSIRRSTGADGLAAAPPVFLPSLQQLANAVAANEGAEISVITYRAGVVDVRLSAPDVATLDGIQKSVSESSRFTASIRSTDRVGDRVNSQIQIREAGS
jgi:general secretion pathway protein L